MNSITLELVIGTHLLMLAATKASFSEWSSLSPDSWSEKGMLQIKGRRGSGADPFLFSLLFVIIFFELKPEETDFSGFLLLCNDGKILL